MLGRVKGGTSMKEVKQFIVVKEEEVKRYINDTAKSVIEELKNNNMLKRELSYYKRVELLLYNYENLKDAVKQKQEDIKDIERYGLPESSKSIVRYSSGGGLTKEDRYVELKDRYLREKIETERDLRRIDNALEKIREDKYYGIIKLKYLNKEEEKVSTDEAIAEIFDKDRKTIVRNRRRLINKLVTIFFPESLKEVM